LGINLSGTDRKLCNYNCVYCFYGLTGKPPADGEYPSADEVVSAVEEALRSDVEADWLTFSGNGESTIHPEFPDIVRRVRRSVDEIRPGLRIALLSNGSTILEDGVRDALQWIDLPVFKLDAGDQETFVKVNRPTGSAPDINDLIEGLHRIATERELTMQSLLFDGDPSNVIGKPFLKWLGALSYIRPHTQQLYSLDFRFGAIYPVEVGILNDIAHDISLFGTHVKVYT